MVSSAFGMRLDAIIGVSCGLRNAQRTSPSPYVHVCRCAPKHYCARCDMVTSTPSHVHNPSPVQETAKRETLDIILLHQSQGGITKV